MADNGWRPFDSVNLCRQGCIDQPRALKDVAVGPVWVLGTQAVADSIVFQYEQRDHHLQTQPPAGHHCRVESRGGWQLQQAIAANDKFAIPSRAPQRLLLFAASIYLRGI